MVFGKLSTGQLLTNVSDAPWHEGIRYANCKLQWSGSDKIDLFAKNISDPETRNQLKELGFDTADSVSYTYNQYGFRDQNFDDRKCGIAFGCSFTEGVGLNAEQTWPYFLSQLTNLHVWNLGVGSSSIDTVFRLLDYWTTKLNPEFVVVCEPPAIRFELILPDRIPVMTINSMYQNNDFVKQWMVNEENHTINNKKNKLAIQQICHQRQIPLIFLTTLCFGADLDVDQKARDLIHPGENAMYKLAQLAHTRLINERL